MTPQQQLANRLYELLPHKKELEFGCEVTVDDMPFTVIGITKGVKYSDGVYPQANLIAENGVIRTSLKITNNPYVDEIIGQPLRLADLLLAIGKVSKPLPELQLFNVHLDISKRGSNGRDNCLYNLQDDNVLNQSNELCEFALDLLK